MRLAVLFALAVSAHAQPSPASSVIRQMISNATIATISSAVLNQGQTQHALYFQYIDVTPGSCSTGTPRGSVQIEASFDGTRWLAITTAPVTTFFIGATTQFQGLAFASGLFPNLRVNLYSAPSAGCKVNAWYSGSVQAYTYPQTLQSQFADFQLGKTLIVSSTGKVVLAPTYVETGKRYAVYGMIISNSSASNPVTLYIGEYPGPPPACGTVVQNYIQISVAASSTTVIPLSANAAYFPASTPETVICADVSGTSPNVSVATIYRLEQ